MFHTAKDETHTNQDKSEDISNYIFIVKVNGIANVTATTIIAKYCDCDNFVELHKP